MVERAKQGRPVGNKCLVLVHHIERVDREVDKFISNVFDGNVAIRKSVGKPDG
jgi:hypothetical protein